MKVAVIGTGYVGLVTGVVLADLGNDVICVDKDREKLDLLKKCVSPIYEPGVEELLERTQQTGFLQVTDSIAEAVRKSEIVFIAVGTPPGLDGTPDVSAVNAVSEEIAKAIEHHVIIVNKSTVPIGMGDIVESIILEHGVDPGMFDVVSNPEFLREGTAVYDTLNPDRIVIGSKRKEAANKLLRVYEPFDCPKIVTDMRSAELIKYASNCFLATKISFINALSRICEVTGADVHEVAKGMGSDKRIGERFLQAGLGWGGSCFPKDVAGLIQIAEHYGYDFEILRAAQEVNKTQTIRFVRLLETALGGVNGKTIALLGLAFKPNTDDIRDAKSREIIEYLLARGAKVRAYDPVATDNMREIFPEVEYVAHAYEVAEDADALMLVTEWKEFKGLDLSRLRQSMRGDLLFDGRHIYLEEHAKEAGFEYFTIGKAAKFKSGVT